MTPKTIEINNKEFTWGMTPNEVLSLFYSENIFMEENTWQQCEIPCFEVAGLKAVTATFRAPSLESPVMQTSFELTAVKSGLFEKVYRPYLKTLNKILGKPHEITKSPLSKGQEYNKGESGSQVIYSCKWWLGEVLVSLSVFGGIRTKKEGEFAAELYFDWFDEEKACEPYLDEFIKTESELLREISDVSVMDVKYGLLQFYKSHYELEDPYLALKNSDVRRSQLILYTDNIYRTPEELSKEFTENKFVLFKSQNTSTWCLGNKWDFTPITKGSKLEYLEVKPTHGLDRVELHVNSLIIQDEPTCDLLSELTDRIEKLTGLKFERSLSHEN